MLSKNNWYHLAMDLNCYPKHNNNNSNADEPFYKNIKLNLAWTKLRKLRLRENKQILEEGDTTNIAKKKKDNKWFIPFFAVITKLKNKVKSRRKI